MPLTFTAGRQKTVILDAVGTVRAARVITNTGYSIARDEIPSYSPKSKSGYEYSSSSTGSSTERGTESVPIVEVGFHRVPPLLSSL